MNKKELIARLKDIEWEDFEVKTAKSEISKNSWETVSAFSNTSGGWLIFGVSQNKNKFEIEGVENSEKIEQNFTTTLRGNKFNQKIIPICKKYKIDNKTILGFYIPLAEKKPIYYNTPKNTFIRTASGDQRLTESEIDSLYRDSAYGTKDKEITKLKINNLDKQTLKQYRQYLENIKPEHQYNKLSDAEFFEKIRVLDENNVTIAGLLVFGNEDSISKKFTDFKIDYFEIFGTSYDDAPKRYEFRLSDYPNIFQYFFAIYERIIKKIDVPFKLKGAFRDENQPQVKAIREALVNLLIHSDYFSPMKPRIRVFTNRIEFFNPGALPKPYEELQKGDISLPRNPLICKMFRIVDLAENAGYGFDKMFKGWENHYLNKPVITTGTDYYRIEFYFETPQVTLQVTPQVTPQANRREIILTFCKEPKTRDEIQKHISIKDREYFRKEVLKPLLDDKLLGLTIPDKPQSSKQRYVITQKGLGVLR
jgi:ATP-dependent DNA helicase RecG